MPTDLLQEIRNAARSLARSRGYALIALLTVALGVGANTAVFSVVNAVLFQPLPYEQPDRLVALWESKRDNPALKSRPTAANYADWVAQNRVFDEMALFGAAGLSWTGDGEPEQLLGSRVSGSYFQVLGAAPLLGRAFRVDDAQPGADAVVILGHGLWQRRFGGRPEVVGESMRLDDQLYTVVGVMPPGLYPTWPATQGNFAFLPRYQQLWVPLALTAEQREDRRSHVYGAIGRLRDGVSLAAAQAEKDTITGRLAEAHPAANRDEAVILNPLADEVVGEVRAALLIVLGAVSLVLLVACANVAGLAMARSVTRSKEIAIRVALGASRWRITRALLIEDVLLTMAGGLVGAMLAVRVVDLLSLVLPADIPRLAEIRVDGVMLGFAAVVAAFAGTLFSLAPILQVTGGCAGATLAAGRRSDSGGSGGGSARGGLVTGQVALAVLLMVSSGLLVRSFWNLQRVDPGFDPDGVLTLELSLPASRYPGASEILGFKTRLLQTVGALPGVQSVATAYNHPLEATWSDGFRFVERPAPEPGRSPGGWMRPVGHDYFETAGVTLIRGRSLTTADDLAHPGVVVVNEAFARMYSPDQDPIEQRIALAQNLPWSTPIVHEIVGVARDVRFLGLDAAPQPAFYRPSAQFPIGQMVLLARTDGDAGALAAAARAAVWSLDPDLPVADTSTMAQHFDNAIAQPRFTMVLIGLFGALALGLATLGVYGMLSYYVAQRTHEIGVRVAIGARAQDVVSLVVARGARLTLVGLGLGLAGAATMSRLMTSVLFEVNSLDAATFTGVAVTLGAVTVAASYLPARRAARIDPITALRQ
jgi:putative ABC transport system permease protein